MFNSLSRLYLPTMFDRVLTRTTTPTLAVFATGPLYREQSAVRAAARYLHTFGSVATANLVARVIKAKVAERSIASVCADHRVPYKEVDDVNDGEFVERLRELNADAAVSVSCPQIFRAPLPRPTARDPQHPRSHPAPLSGCHAQLLDACER